MSVVGGDVVSLSEAFSTGQLAARKQWERLYETGLRPSILLEGEKRVLDKAAHDVMSLTLKERNLLDEIYGEVFNAVGAVRMTDEEHLLRAYQGGDPHKYIEENVGVFAQDRHSSGLGRMNADDLHACVANRQMPSPCSNTPREVREGLQAYLESTREWPTTKKPDPNLVYECGLR